MAHPVLYVADAILKIAKAKSVKLTPLQLMKLVYISHGWLWAIKDKDLFPERIEAWKYGPVVPDLYHATKQYGRDPIPFENIGDQSPSIDDDTNKFLQDVFEQYGNLSGIALSDLTHRSGTPWDQVYRDGVKGLEIDDNLIKNHYVRLLNEYQAASSTAAT